RQATAGLAWPTARRPGSIGPRSSGSSSGQPSSRRRPGTSARASLRMKSWHWAKRWGSPIAISSRRCWRSGRESWSRSPAAPGAGVVGAGLVVVLGALFPLALLPVPVALGIGFVTARRYGPALQRIQLGLERMLDHLEHSGTRPERQLPTRAGGLLGLLADEV